MELKVVENKIKWKQLKNPIEEFMRNAKEKLKLILK
jgi:hypothetical protein